MLATLSATRSERLIDQGDSTAAALTEGYQLAFLIGAGLVAVAIAVAATVLQSDRGAPVKEVEPGPAPVQAEPAYREAA